MARRGKRLGELGVSGLERQGGRIYEEWLHKLQGLSGTRILREMRDNCVTIGAAMFAVEMMLRSVAWETEPYSEDPKHLEQAETLSQMRDDMEHSWSDLMSEIVTMLTYGFSLFEIVWKVRKGPMESSRERKSRHTDGLLAPRKIAPRAQVTIDEWIYDDEDNLAGAWQQPMTYYGGSRGFSRIPLPMEKLLLFRTTSKLGNPEGRSVLRNLYTSWWRKNGVEESESIGIERELTGVPKILVPSEVLNSTDPVKIAARNAYQKVGEDLRNDEQAYVMFPSDRDENGELLYDISLMSSGGTRLFDTSAIIARYERQMLQALMAEFIMLGASSAGSFALADSKTDMFAVALGAWLHGIADVLNTDLVPRIYRMNGWDMSECAKFRPGDLESVDVEKWSQAYSQIVTAGGITPGGRSDEEYIRGILGMPEAKDDVPEMGVPDED